MDKSMNQVTITYDLKQQEEQEQQKWVATQLIALNLPPPHQQMMMVTTFGLSSTREKKFNHPKFKVDNMVLVELMDMEIPFCSEQILVEHQLGNCSSLAVITKFAFNFLGHHQHFYNNNNNFANLQARCLPPANSFWPLGHPIPSLHFTYEA